MSNEIEHSKLLNIFHYTFAINGLDFLEYNLLKSALYHPINIREVIKEHARLFEDGEYFPVNVDEFEYQPLIIKRVVEEIYDLTDEIKQYDYHTFPDLVQSAEKYLLTLDGAYDMFLFMYGGIEGLMQSYQSGAQFKAMMVAMLENNTGINVRERFREAVDGDGVLNLNINKDIEDEEPELSPEEIRRAQKAGIDIEGILQSKRDLKNKLKQDKKNPKKHYNWQSDTGFKDQVDASSAFNNLRPGGG